MRNRTSVLMKMYLTSSERLSPNKEGIPVIKKKFEDLMAKYPDFTPEQLKTINVPFFIVVGDHDMINLD